MFYDDSIRVIVRHLLYEYHYSPHKPAFQNIMRAGDHWELMIDLEWPYAQYERLQAHTGTSSRKFKHGTLSLRISPHHGLLAMLLCLYRQLIVPSL